MADHVRQQIRDKVVGILTGLPLTGPRVFPSRRHPVDASRMPCILVYALDEQIGVGAQGGSSRRLERMLRLTVEILAQASESVEDTLDDIAVSVEEALAEDLSLEGLSKDLFPISTEIAFSAQSELSLGGCRIIYQVPYHTRQNAPDVAA